MKKVLHFISVAVLGIVICLTAFNIPAFAQVAPTEPATYMDHSNIKSDRVTIKWENGNGAARIVLIAKSTDGGSLPTDGVTYTANAVNGLGSAVGSTHTYCVYNGKGNNVTITGLKPDEVYTVYIYEYNGTPGNERYTGGDPSRGNPATMYTATAATLSGISGMGLPLYPAFSPDIHIYNITVPVGAFSAKTITPVATDPLSVIKYGNQDVANGVMINSGSLVRGSITLGATTFAPNDLIQITLTVTAPDGAASSYQFNYRTNVITHPTPPVIVFDPIPATNKIGDDVRLFSHCVTSSEHIYYYSSNPAVAIVEYQEDTGNERIHMVGAGTATISAVMGEGHGYQAAAPATQNISVSKGRIVVIADNKTKTIGSANPALTLSYSGFQDGEAASAFTSPPTVTTAATKTSALGNYDIVASGGTSDDYYITYQKGTLTVQKAVLTVTVSDVSRPYGAANPAATLTYSGFLNGDNESVLRMKPVSKSMANATSDVGDYVITGSGGSAVNYSFNFVPGTLTVTPAPLVITAANKIKGYGKAAVALTLTYSGFKNRQTAAILTAAPVLASDGNTTAAVAGTYSITPTGASATNYDITYMPGVLTVSKAPLKVAVAAKSKSYGAENPAFTATISGWVNGDGDGVTPILTCAADASSNAGKYPIIASGITTDNYTVTYVPSNLTINKVPLTVTANNITRFRDQANPDVFPLTYKGFLMGQDESILIALPVGTTTATGTSPAGRYPITVSGGIATNYSFVYKSGSLTVSPGMAPIAVLGGNDFLKNSIAASQTTPAESDALNVHQALSPNGDGLNDYMVIEGIEKYPSNTVTIVNQNGSAIYETSGYDNSTKRFDGRNNKGAMQQAGTYFYLISYSDNGQEKRKTGYIVIK